MQTDILDLIKAIEQEKLPKPCRTVEDSTWNQCIDFIIAAHLKPFNKALQVDAQGDVPHSNARLTEFRLMLGL